MRLFSHLFSSSSATPPKKAANLTPRQMWASLLEFMAHPALLVEENGQAHVVAANEQAALHSGYPLALLTDLSWEQLFPEMPWSTMALLAGEKVHTFLQTRAGQSADVWCRGQKISTEQRLWVVLFSPLAEEVLFPLGEENDTLLLQAVEALLGAWDAPSLDAALQQAIKGSLYFLQGAWGSVYLADTPAYRLKVGVGDAADLPLILPLTYGNAFSTPHLYTPATSDDSVFGMLVRRGDTPYVAVAPLGTANERGGLVAFGFAQKPLPSTLPKIAMTGVYLWRMIAYFYCRQRQANHPVDVSSVPAALMRHAKEAVLLFDQDLHLTSLNPSAEEMLGYNAAEVVGTPFAELIVGTPTLEAAVQKALLQSDEAAQVLETRLLRRDGTEIPAEVRIAPYTGAPKETEGVLLLISDLSKEAHYRQQTEALMRRAMLGDVLASFAHEVRDPLNSLSTGLEWLAFSLNENTEATETLRNLQAEVERLGHLVTNLLDFGRARPLKWQALDIGMVLKGIFRRWQRRFSRYHIDARLHLADNLPLVHGDRLSLEQVFANLIDNAIHALKEMREERFLVVSARSVMENNVTWVEVNVVDNGPGFDEETRRHLFDPFFTRREEGTGLGLAIAKQLITAHKGSIEAMSYPRAGTVFRVRLRAAQPIEETRPSNGIQHPDR